MPMTSLLMMNCMLKGIPSNEPTLGWTVSGRYWTDSIQLFQVGCLGITWHLQSCYWRKFHENKKFKSLLCLHRCCNHDIPVSHLSCNWGHVHSPLTTHRDELFHLTRRLHEAYNQSNMCFAKRNSQSQALWKNLPTVPSCSVFPLRDDRLLSVWNQQGRNPHRRQFSGQSACVWFHTTLPFSSYGH